MQKSKSPKFGSVFQNDAKKQLHLKKQNTTQIQNEGLLNLSERDRKESTVGFDQKYVQWEQQNIVNLVNQEMLNSFNKESQQPRSTSETIGKKVNKKADFKKRLTRRKSMRNLLGLDPKLGLEYHEWMRIQALFAPKGPFICKEDQPKPEFDGHKREPNESKITQESSKPNIKLFDKNSSKTFVCRKGSRSQIKFRKLNVSVLMGADAALSQEDICQSVSSDENSRDMNMLHIDSTVTKQASNNKRESPSLLSNAPGEKKKLELLQSQLDVSCDESINDSDLSYYDNETLIELIQNVELQGQKLLQKIEIQRGKINFIQNKIRLLQASGHKIKESLLVEEQEVLQNLKDKFEVLELRWESLVYSIQNEEEILDDLKTDATRQTKLKSIRDQLRLITEVTDDFSSTKSQHKEINEEISSRNQQIQPKRKNGLTELNNFKKAKKERFRCQIVMDNLVIELM